MSTVAVDLRQTVEDAAAHLYVWALKDIPQDLRDALVDAQQRETSVPGRRVLDTIVKNVQVADDRDNLVCQDTGIAVYTCRVGEHFPLHPAKIYEALYAGTERATLEHPLRSNAVHTITRENTGANVGYRLPIVHWEFIPDWDGLDVKCVPEGLGLREHELPEDVRPRRRREGDQAVRARVDRRRRRQAVPARDRRRRHRRLGRLRDVPRQGGDRPPDRHAQQRSDRGGARGRADGPPERDRDRPDGPRRRRDRPQLPHRARGHAHDPQPRRGQLPVLGRPPRDRARGANGDVEFDREA